MQIECNDLKSDNTLPFSFQVGMMCILILTFLNTNTTTNNNNTTMYQELEKTYTVGLHLFQSPLRQQAHGVIIIRP